MDGAMERAARHADCGGPWAAAAAPVRQPAEAIRGTAGAAGTGRGLVAPCLLAFDPEPLLDPGPTMDRILSACRHRRRLVLCRGRTAALAAHAFRQPLACLGCPMVLFELDRAVFARTCCRDVGSGLRTSGSADRSAADR